MPGVDVVLQAWLDGQVVLERALAASGEISLLAGDCSGHWRLPTDALEWTGDHDRSHWSLPLAARPEVLLLGAGPEAPALLRLLRDLGWRTTLAEPRARWRDAGALADAHDDDMATALDGSRRFAAVLVMHHAFERDRDALDRLAATPVPFVGLLGPPQRRDDLLGLLATPRREALAGRLRAPVGLDLGGQGPEAIALSIAAQLQQWRAQAGA